MQSSPPHSDGKARAIRELSASLNHSQRSISPVQPAPSDSNPTKRSGFGDDDDNTLDFFNNEDVLMSTQHGIDEDTNTLPQYPRIRSTAKKINSWRPFHSEQPNPDTSMVNKMFDDFSASEEEDVSIEQARGNGGHRSNRSTPAKHSRGFDSLYDITPPTNRSRKSYAAETGSLRRDAQIRRASRNDLDTSASPRPASARKSLAAANNQERKRPSLAQLHAKVSEDESSFLEERPPTVTLQHSRNTRWGNRSRQTSLQTDGNVDASPRVTATPRSRPGTAHNTTAQSFVLPDMPNLTELVSGIFEDGTPVFSKSIPSRSRFPGPNNGGRRQPAHISVDSVPIPQDEKAIFTALQLLQDKVAQMESERADAEKKMEEQELEIIELKATTQAQERLRRSDSALGSTDGEGSGKGSWRVEKTRLDATVQTLRTKLDRTERKYSVVEIEKKRLGAERDNMAGQLGVAFQTCEELKLEKEALRSENDSLRQEINLLRDQLDQEQARYQEETVQLHRQVDQNDNATQRENMNLQKELAHVRAQQDEHNQQLARKENELRKARQEQAEYARLKANHDALKSQLANLKAKRDEDLRRWSSQEAALKSKVETRDETIRLFQDANQEQTNEAMRLDNEHLRDELAQLAAQHEEDNLQWSKKESELKRKILQREEAARHAVDMTQEVLGLRQANNQQRSTTAAASRDKNDIFEGLQRKPSRRRDENTRTRIRNRVQEESRNSRANASFQSSHFEESPRKPFIKISRTTHRSASAPMPPQHIAELESETDSTTDISLAPRGTPYLMRGAASGKPPITTVRPPADMDITELSFIDSAQIARLRQQLEQERAAARGRAVSVPLECTAWEDTIRSERRAREDTVRSEHQAREDTVRSVVSIKSARQASFPTKSSMKDATKTNATQFEEDLTGNVSNLDNTNAEATHTRQSAVDISLLSNTSRRRRSAPTEMTSAFIVPDIKIGSRKQTTVRMEQVPNAHSKHHDNDNCTYCRRQASDSSADPLRVPKLVPVSSRMPDDVDATLRPSRSPKEALALVVKELQDERAHLHMELAVMRAMLEAHDPSLGRKKRVALEQAVAELLAKIQTRDDQIYHLYDVLEGQQDHDITEQFVDDVTEQLRAEDAEVEKKSKEKKVTIQSFHEDEDEDSGEELPWEGFEDTADRDFIGNSGRLGVY